MIFKCFDLETTGIDVATCEVVQAAVVKAESLGAGVDLAGATSHESLFYAKSIPAGATAVHGITADRVAESPPFYAVVRAFVRALTAEDTVTVTFNGCGYDIPIVARYAAPREFPGTDRMDEIPTQSQVDLIARDLEALLCTRHVDVMRLWARARAEQRPVSWHDSDPHLLVHAGCFGGSLMGAHAYWFGETFDGAHDAAADCYATLRVFDAMLRTEFVDVETAIQWSNEPLPGDVDFAGKFKWEGDQVVLTIGKQAGTPIEEVDIGFLRWMLSKDFHRDTKAIVRGFLAGTYPVRKT